MRIRLTEKVVAGLKHEGNGNQVFYLDERTPGLAVRVTQNGMRSYIVEGQLHKRSVRITIGSCAEWPLENKWDNVRDDEGRTVRVLIRQGARERATELRAKLDRGIDPRLEAQAHSAALKAKKDAALRAQLASDEAKKYSLAALCAEYVDYLERNGKHKSALETKSIFNVHVSKAFPEIAALPANAVTKEQVVEIVRKVREAGKDRTAGILRSYLVAAYNYAAREDTDPNASTNRADFKINGNPALLVKAIPVAEVDRHLSRSELRDYINALGDSIEDQALRIALYAGGQRMAQLLRATVSDWDEDVQALRLLDGKGRRTTPRTHLLPLGPKAVETISVLVAAAKKEKRSALFPNKSDGHVDPNTLSKRVTEIRNAIGAEQFNLRDVRRTVETFMSRMGISEETRAYVLSHGLGGIQKKRYNRNDFFTEKRNVLLAWEQELESIAKGDAPNNKVVSIRGAA